MTEPIAVDIPGKPAFARSAVAPGPLSTPSLAPPALPRVELSAKVDPAKSEPPRGDTPKPAAAAPPAPKPVAPSPPPPTALTTTPPPTAPSVPAVAPAAAGGGFSMRQLKIAASAVLSLAAGIGAIRLLSGATPGTTPDTTAQNAKAAPPAQTATSPGAPPTLPLPAGQPTVAPKVVPEQPIRFSSAQDHSPVEPPQSAPVGPDGKPTTPPGGYQDTKPAGRPTTPVVTPAGAGGVAQVGGTAIPPNPGTPQIPAPVGFEPGPLSPPPPGGEKPRALPPLPGSTPPTIGVEPGGPARALPAKDPSNQTGAGASSSGQKQVPPPAAFPTWGETKQTETPGAPAGNRICFPSRPSFPRPTGSR